MEVDNKHSKKRKTRPSTDNNIDKKKKKKKSKIQLTMKELLIKEKEIKRKEKEIRLWEKERKNEEKLKIERKELKRKEKLKKGNKAVLEIIKSKDTARSLLLRNPLLLYALNDIAGEWDLFSLVRGTRFTYPTNWFPKVIVNKIIIYFIELLHTEAITFKDYYNGHYNNQPYGALWIHTHKTKTKDLRLFNNECECPCHNEYKHLWAGIMELPAAAQRLSHYYRDELIVFTREKVWEKCSQLFLLDTYIKIPSSSPSLWNDNQLKI